MTSYNIITDAETDPSAPLTSELAKKWRDNPVAIASKDSSVPNNLRLGNWHLGTLTTTSGASQTLSGIDLTPYKFLIVVFNSVSANSTNSSLQIGSMDITPNLGTPGWLWRGTLLLDLATGVFSANIGQSSFVSPYSTAASPYAGDCNYTNATTSVTFSVDTGSFTSGSILVYGSS